MKEKHFYEFSHFLLDPVQHILLRKGVRVHLHPKTFLILQTLVEARGEVVSKEALMTEIWPDVVVEEGNLTKNISLLRKALGNGSGSVEFIETISKIGYRFIAPFKLVEDSQETVGRTHRVTAEPPRPFKWKLLPPAALLLVIIAAGAGFCGRGARKLSRRRLRAREAQSPIRFTSKAGRFARRERRKGFS